MDLSSQRRVPYRKQFSIQVYDENIINVLKEKSDSKLRTEFLMNLLTAYTYNLDFRMLVDNGGRAIEDQIEYSEPNNILDDFEEIHNMLNLQSSVTEVGIDALSQGLDDVLDLVDEKIDARREEYERKKEQKKEEQRLLAIEKKKEAEKLKEDGETAKEEPTSTTQTQANDTINIDAIADKVVDLLAQRFNLNNGQISSMFEAPKTEEKQTETGENKPKPIVKEVVIKEEPKEEVSKNAILNEETNTDSVDDNDDSLFDEDLGSVEPDTPKESESVSGEAKENISNLLASLMG